jgi:hypothetical protein
MTYCRVAAILGQECASTALIWAMHCLQVAVLVDEGGGRFGQELEEISRHGGLIASVTSEPGAERDFMSTDAPLRQEQGGYRVVRESPSVSYGEEAAFFFVKVRASESTSPTDGRLILVSRADGEIAAKGGWHGIGMRGTRSVPMHLNAVSRVESFATSAASDFQIPTTWSSLRRPKSQPMAKRVDRSPHCGTRSTFPGSCSLICSTKRPERFISSDPTAPFVAEDPALADELCVRLSGRLEVAELLEGRDKCNGRVADCSGRRSTQNG